MNTEKGRYGSFGGRYSPEVLMGTLTNLETAFNEAMTDPDFMAEYRRILMSYSCRPTPLYFAENLTRELKGGKVYLKREDLNHTGSHKINNVIGQTLLARRMGKKKVIAETGAGQHGVATATAAALMGLSCTVFMGREDTQRQALNVARMEMLGATVVPVDSGTGTLKDATNEAMRYWAGCSDDTFYVIGSVVGPHPYPTMVTAFQRIIGDEVRARMLELEGRLPSHCIACVGGGSNAIGLFTAFLEDREVQLIGVEAAGEGLDTGRHAASITMGNTGILHGMKSLLLQDAFGQVLPAHSISAGLDYPGVGPQHAHLHTTGRARYETATDAEALDALLLLTRLEGIIPAMESAHAVACAMRIVPQTTPDDIIVINLSGRGEKDIERVARIIKEVQS